MRKSIVAVVAVASVAAGAVWATRPVEKRVVVPEGLSPPPVFAQLDPGSYRKPFLRARNRQSVPKGMERVTIPVDGVLYEMIVTRPGLGQLVDAGVRTLGSH